MDTVEGSGVSSDIVSFLSRIFRYSPLNDRERVSSTALILTQARPHKSQSDESGCNQESDPSTGCHLGQLS